MSADPAIPNPFQIRVDTAGQTLHLLSNGAPVKSWPVSTSKFGIGFGAGSFKTPAGRFRIVEKIGGAAAPWAEFQSRLPTGRIAKPGGDQDAILSRILWLDGLDDSNANTKARMIYIHGTNQEDLIGQPASHGCIRLRNADVCELFALVPAGTPVLIA